MAASPPSQDDVDVFLHFHNNAGAVNNEQNVGGLPVDEVPVQTENLLGVAAVNNEHIKGDLPVEA
jgi:hypothetical protein